MKVLAISYGKNFFTTGNTERQRMLECARVVDEYHIIVFSHESEKLEEEVIEGKLFLHPTNSKNAVGKIFDAIRLGRKILKEKGEWVITSQDPFEAGLAGLVLAKFSRTPFNVQEHGDFYSTKHWQRESRLHAVRAGYGTYVLRSATTVRVVSERIKTTLVALGIPAEKIIKLSVSIDARAFKEAVPNPSLIPAYNSAETYVLTVARFVPQKNLTLLIRAFKKASSEFPKAKLLVVGTGPLEGELRELAGDSGQVVFMPWSEDVPSLMKTTHVYTLSSNYEGWGRVLVEAQASGLPIVTTDVGCVKEFIKPGPSVEVVPIGDELAFTAALERTLKHIREASLAAQVVAQSMSDANTPYAMAWKKVLEETIASKV